MTQQMSSQAYLFVFHISTLDAVHSADGPLMSVVFSVQSVMVNLV